MDNQEKIDQILENQKIIFDKLEQFSNFNAQLDNVMEAVDDRTKLILEIFENKLNFINHLENIMEAIDDRTKEILIKMIS